MRSFIFLIVQIISINIIICSNEIIKNIKLTNNDTRKINNFIVLKIGGGITGFMNNLSFSDHKNYNKYLENIPIISALSNIFKYNINFKINDICKNIKEKGLTYLISNYNIGLDLTYNKNIIKSFYMTFGISGRFESKIITNPYLKNLRIYLDEFNTLKNNLNEISKKENNKKNNNDEDLIKIINENKFEIKNEKEKFDYLHDTTSYDYDAFTLKFLKIGGIIGTSFFFNRENIKKSFFIGIYTFLRYRKLLSLSIEQKYNKNEYIEINNNALRINPFDISFGFEFGKNNNISVLFEIGITSILGKISTQNHNNTERIYQKNKIKLRDINISIRYNKL